MVFRFERCLASKQLSNLAGRKCIYFHELKKQPVQENYYETGSESEDDVSPMEEVILFYMKLS